MSIKTHKSQPLTSVFHKLSITPPKNGPPPLLVFIPGNPGLVKYYDNYLKSIQETYPFFELLNISHAGFGEAESAASAKDFEFYNLDFQIIHKVKIIKEYSSKCDSSSSSMKRDIYIMGHSVGSYILQRVVTTLINDNEFSSRNQFKFIGMICPTIIDIADSASGVKFSFVSKWFPIIRIAVFFSWVSSLFPEKILCFLLKKILTSPSPDAIEATSLLVRTPRIVRQALSLAQEEMKVIKRDDAFNDNFYKLSEGEQNIKIWNFFSVSDHWVHDTSRDYLLSRYGDKLRTNRNLYFMIGHMNTDIKHSFCVNQSEPFANITREVLGEFFPDLREI